MPKLSDAAAIRPGAKSGVDLSRLETAMPTEAQPFAPEILFNVHPADELAEVREKIKTLSARADTLRDKLLEDGADLKGDEYTAQLHPGTRETLDRKALVETYGEAAIAPFLKKTQFTTVKLVEN